MGKSRKFYGWTLLVALWAILAINMGATVYGSGVINAYMASSLGLDRSTLGGAFGLFQWTSGLPGPLVAWCVNRKGARFTLIVGSLLLLAGAAAMALFVRTAMQFTVIFGVLVGLAAVIAGPLAIQATIARWFVRRRAMAMSLVLTAPAIGGSLAAPVLDRWITMSHGDWRAGWWLIAAGGALSTIMTVLFVKETPQALGQIADGDSPTAGAPRESASAESGPRAAIPPATIPDLDLAQVVRTPTFWLMLTAVIGLFSGFMMFAAHGVIHLKDLGFTASQAASSFSLVFLALLGGNLLFAAIGDRIDSRYVLSAASAALGVGLALALQPPGTLGLYLYPVLLGGGFGVGFSTMMVLPGSYFGDKAYVSIVGIILALSTTYGALGAFGAGYAYDHLGGYAPAFRSVTILCLVGAVLALFLRPPAAPTSIPTPSAAT